MTVQKIAALAALVTGLLMPVQSATAPGAAVPQPVNVSGATSVPTPNAVTTSTQPAVLQPPSEKESALTVPVTSGFAKQVGDAAVLPDGTTYPIRTYKALAAPNDPFAQQTWQTNASINQVWDVPRGQGDTLLAVIDSGFALQHEEFAGRWYANTGEVVNGVDDDRNGLIDDASGWDFVNDDNHPQAVTAGSHGTQVAGLAAATGNNGKGLAGVDWGTRILPLQVLDEDGLGTNVGVANAIRYAADLKADVINLSLGGSEPDELTRAAVRYALSKGSIVVAAAGNDGCNCMSYPANYPEVIAVGATRSDGQPASFSAYGENLDIMAPGTGLISSDWNPATPTSGYASQLAGTSFAAPIVSGMLTRLKSQQPSATSLQLTAALTENTDRRLIEAGHVRSSSVGYGSLKGSQALQRLTMPYAPVQRYDLTGISLGAEPRGNTNTYICESSQIGTTPIYELKRSTRTIFSASHAEIASLTAQGYASSFFVYGCVTQPHDRPTVAVRSINVFKEFRNSDDK